MPNFLLTTLEAAPFGFIVVSGDRVMVEVNGPAERLLGQARTELEGRPVFDALRMPLNHRLSAMLDLLAWGNEAEVRTRVTVGERQLEVIASPIAEVPGVATVISIQDVTGRVATEVEQSVLVEARAAEQRTQEFLAALGHELRNPLAPIISSLDVLQRHSNSGELAEVRHHVEHLLKTVTDLLDMSKLTRGKLQLEWKQLELASVVNQAVFQAELGTRRNDLTVDVAAEGLLVNADPLRLGQALGNLLSNAARYSEPGSAIVVSAERRGPVIAVKVVDQGHGLDAEHVANLFRPFAKRAHRAEGGVGLGLSLAQSIVELSGGKLSAQSAGLGRGSTFEVVLPAVETAAPAAAAFATPSSRGFDVLVVDDNVDGAELLGDLLVLLGHQVRVANTPSHALQLCTESMPHIIFSDIDLPEMTGHQLAEKLRLLPGGAASQLIAVTGFGSPEDASKSFAAGFNKHLVKPVLVETLESVLAEVRAATSG